MLKFAHFNTGFRDMRQRVFIMLMFFVFLGLCDARAQENQSPPVLPQGIICAPLNDATLCAINLTEEDAQWFLLGPENRSRIGAFSAAMRLIFDINVSADEKYAAVLSVGEGHPILEMIDFPAFLQKKTYRVLQMIDPYPGTIAVRKWDGNTLHVECDMLLTHLDKKTNRVPFEFMLYSMETFAIDMTTGKISGVSEGARLPFTHYAKALINPQMSESEKDAAFTTLLKFGNEMPVSAWFALLDQEKTPKRILKILEEIEKRHQHE